jgi:hypothetical protein
MRLILTQSNFDAMSMNIALACALYSIYGCMQTEYKKLFKSSVSRDRYRLEMPRPEGVNIVLMIMKITSCFRVFNSSYKFHRGTTVQYIQVNSLHSIRSTLSTYRISHTIRPISRWLLAIIWQNNRSLCNLLRIDCENTT